MSNSTQANRFLQLETVLGDDALIISAASGNEALGRLSEFRVEFNAARDNVDLDSLLGTPATLTLRLAAERGKAAVANTRYFNGYFSRITCVGYQNEGRAKYRATMVPWFWFMTRTSDCRIFQNLSVTEIIRNVFSDAGFPDYQFDLRKTYSPLEYCVQYRETDFNFVSRLMEREGIYYHFVHQNGSHVMVLCDDMMCHTPEENFETLSFIGGSPIPDRLGVITEWEYSREVKPGSFAHNDFNFLTPRPDPNHRLISRSSTTNTQNPRPFEIYDAPGGFGNTEEGTRYARIRMEELLADRDVATARTNIQGVCAGRKFTLARHPNRTQNHDHLVISVQWSAREGAYGSGGEGSEEFFDCAFTCIPHTAVFRPIRLSIQPKIEGPQTATVCGPRDEEIHVDEYGRVKVQFHWDRYGESDARSSCWIRVSQTWAGKRWGGMAIPRIGHEVIVDFLEGDPDRPIITGRVYNGDHLVPYELPQEKTKTTLKSNSSIGGQGFNEIRFEDKKNEEQVFIHSQRRMDIRVRGSEYETTYGSRHIRVGWESGGDSGGNFDIFVRQDQNFHLEGDTFVWHGAKSGNLYTKIDGDLKSIVEKSSEHLVKETLSIQSKAELHQTELTTSFYTTNFIIQGTNGVDINSGDRLHLTGTHGVNLLADADVAIAGNHVHIKGAVAVNIEANTAINLKCGGASIAITPASVTIVAPIINLNSGAGAGPAQGAEQAVNAEQLGEVAFDGPLDAIISDDGRPGGIHRYGGGGGLARTRPRFSAGPMVPRDPPPPPNTGPGRNEPPGCACEQPRIMTIQWNEREVYCSEPATVNGEVGNCPDRTTVRVTIKALVNNSTYANVDTPVSGGTYSYDWKVVDVLPTRTPQDHENLDGFAEGHQTPHPLKVKFITDIPVTTWNGGGQVYANFQMEVREHEIHVSRSIRYGKGYGVALIRLNGHAGVPAASAVNAQGERWMIRRNGAYAYWDGSAWLPLPATVTNAVNISRTVGLYRTGANFVDQSSGAVFPDSVAIAEWDINAADVTAMISTWESHIHSAWSDIFDVKRVTCESASEHCCRYRVSVNGTFVRLASYSAADFAARNILVTKNGDGQAIRSHAALFFLDDGRPRMPAHEFGHFMGLPDEYSTGNPNVGAGTVVDAAHIMGTVENPPADRHFLPIVNHMKTMVASHTGKSFSYMAVPHVA